MRRIVVFEHNYFTLKKLGYAGDSFTDVISTTANREELSRNEEEARRRIRRTTTGEQ